MAAVRKPQDREKPAGPPTPSDGSEPKAPAWELIEAGRYMPRRIRGSYRGRELG